MGCNEGAGLAPLDRRGMQAKSSAVRSTGAIIAPLFADRQGMDALVGRE